MKHDPLAVLNTIAQAIFDKKGINILALDLRKVSTITDFVIIAEGSVDRHTIAIGRAVESAMEKIGEKPLHIEGMQTGDWVVLDYFDTMVHIFSPGVEKTIWKISGGLENRGSLNKHK
jgi:ribosome-associated protein